MSFAIEQFVNKAQSQMVGSLNNSATTLTILSAASFPTQGNFRIRVDTELMLCTAVSGNVLTVTRGIEGTTAASHAAGAAVTATGTAAGLKNNPLGMTAAFDEPYLDSSGNQNRLAASRRALPTGDRPGSWERRTGGADSGAPRGAPNGAASIRRLSQRFARRQKNPGKTGIFPNFCEFLRDFATLPNIPGGTRTFDRSVKREPFSQANVQEPIADSHFLRATPWCRTVAGLHERETFSRCLSSIA